jgi:hypothetical protein
MSSIRETLMEPFGRVRRPFEGSRRPGQSPLVGPRTGFSGPVTARRIAATQAMVMSRSNSSAAGAGASGSRGSSGAVATGGAGGRGGGDIAASIIVSARASTG